MGVSVYATTDDEREAREVADRLFREGQRASVERVFFMALCRDPLTPHTANRFAILVATDVSSGFSRK